MPIKKNSPVGYKAWNPIIKRVQCWDKEGRIKMDSGKKAIVREHSTG